MFSSKYGYVFLSLLFKTVVSEQYFSYCTTDFHTGCDVYDPSTVTLTGSPTEIEIECYNEGHNFCLEIKELVLTSVCEDEEGCMCPEGSCEMPHCKSNCSCAGGFCDMPKCTEDCYCMGYCSMPKCRTDQFYFDYGGCDYPIIPCPPKESDEEEYPYSYTGKYISYCTTDFDTGCDAYDPSTVTLTGSPTEIEIECYMKGHNFCLEIEKVVQPYPFTSVCEDEEGCVCPEGSCEMPHCKSNCSCAGGLCDMPMCTEDCDCMGYCSMPKCTDQCYCDHGCDYPNCCGDCTCKEGCNKQISVNTDGLPEVLCPCSYFEYDPPDNKKEKFFTGKNVMNLKILEFRQMPYA